MAHFKLTLDEDFEDAFELVAIHCSVEDFRMAYLLNREAHMKFERSETDLDFKRKNEQVLFSIFEFEDAQNHIKYNLIANKSYQIKYVEIGLENAYASLFYNKAQTHYLLPELSKIDYFIKVEHEGSVFPLKELVTAINGIKQVVTAYTVDVKNIKSKENLIFEI